MEESAANAACTAEVTADQSRAEEVVGPSRAEYVQQVLGTARATLARSRQQFRERPADVTGAPERSRGRPLAPRDRTSPPPAPTETPNWAEDRAAVFEAISSLRQLCESLADELHAIRWRQLGSVFDTPHAAFGELSRWAREDRARADVSCSSSVSIGNGEPTRHSRDDQKPEAPAAAHPAPEH